jgi:hypothetical protein
MKDQLNIFNDQLSDLNFFMVHLPSGEMSSGHKVRSILFLSEEPFIRIVIVGGYESFTPEDFETPTFSNKTYVISLDEIIIKTWSLLRKQGLIEEAAGKAHSDIEKLENYLIELQSRKQELEEQLKLIR